MAILVEDRARIGTPTAFVLYTRLDDDGTFITQVMPTDTTRNHLRITVHPGAEQPTYATILGDDPLVQYCSQSVGGYLPAGYWQACRDARKIARRAERQAAREQAQATIDALNAADAADGPGR
jgi:hypothetical protein